MNLNDKPAASGSGLRRPESREAGARMFVPEPGWRVSVKRGSERSFCHVMAPGQDFYHRLQDGEIYLHQGSERICVSCAARRGILSFEPRRLPDEGPKFLVDSGEMPIFVVGGDEAK